MPLPGHPKELSPKESPSAGVVYDLIKEEIKSAEKVVRQRKLVLRLIANVSNVEAF